MFYLKNVYNSFFFKCFFKIEDNLAMLLVNKIRKNTTPKTAPPQPKTNPLSKRTPPKNPKTNNTTTPKTPPQTQSPKTHMI